MMINVLLVSMIVDNCNPQDSLTLISDLQSAELVEGSQEARKERPTFGKILTHYFTPDIQRSTLSKKKQGPRESSKAVSLVGGPHFIGEIYTVTAGDSLNLSQSSQSSQTAQLQIILKF